jgi:L-ascorbate metabolism protein UlaG (beta-lactamase superfamily)
MKITYHGHSFVQLESNGNSILVDPFITDNPLCKINPGDVKCNYIILTHGHGDHYGDTIEIAKKNDALVIATFELAEYVINNGVKAHHSNLGGGYNFPFGRVKLTIAHHSSSTPDGTYVGEAGGALVTMSGKTVYHAGDTALFYDMKLIGEMNKIDYAFLPIGDNFTMGIDEAVKASELINAAVVTPMHYNTFDVIKADPDDFKKKIESIGKKCNILNPGDSVDV